MTVVIAGGGPVGMLAALIVKRRHPRARVVLLERDRALGGLFRSHRYSEDVVFDCGTHLYYDTGNEEIDAVVQGLMPDDEWIILEGNRKDVAGAFFNGRLQVNSAYLDLRNQPQALLDTCLDEMTRNIARPAPSSEDAGSYLRWRFGETIASTFVDPVLERLYRHPASELSAFAARLTAMDRVIMFDEARMLEIMGASDGLRARLAYPDQLRFPGVRPRAQRALYPRRGGMERFVDACARALDAAGVDVCLEHQVQKLECGAGGVERLEVRSPRGAMQFSSRDEGGLHVFWACGVPALASQLGIPPAAPPERAPRGILVHLLFEKPVRIDDVYYFYVYDPGFLTFRVTCYGNYCPALLGAGVPVTVELWPHSDDTKSAEHWIETAQAELRAFGVLAGVNTTTLSRVEALKENLPRPTLRNRDALRALRAEVSARRPANLDVIGSGAEDDLFFLHDTLEHMHRTLAHLDA